MNIFIMISYSIADEKSMIFCGHTIAKNRCLHPITRTIVYVQIVWVVVLLVHNTDRILIVTHKKKTSVSMLYMY